MCIRDRLRSRHLTVRYGARVLHLEWSRQARRVEAVIFRDAATGTENRLPCRAVVLAAGAIGTPAILLASSSTEFPDGLGNTHGVLGRYLHDHPLGKLTIDLDAPISVHPASYLTRPKMCIRDSPRARPIRRAWTRGMGKRRRARTFFRALPPEQAPRRHRNGQGAGSLRSVRATRKRAGVACPSTSSTTSPCSGVRLTEKMCIRDRPP